MKVDNCFDVIDPAQRVDNFFDLTPDPPSQPHPVAPHDPRLPIPRPWWVAWPFLPSVTREGCGCHQAAPMCSGGALLGASFGYIRQMALWMRVPRRCWITLLNARSSSILLRHDGGNPLWPRFCDGLGGPALCRFLFPATRR